MPVEVKEGQDARQIVRELVRKMGDEKAELILGNCRTAMAAHTPDARLIIIEAIIPGRNEVSIASLLDLEVLVMGSGKERTVDEFRDLFGRAGFELSRVIGTEEGVSILECVEK